MMQCPTSSNLISSSKYHCHTLLSTRCPLLVRHPIEKYFHLQPRAEQHHNELAESQRRPSAPLTFISRTQRFTFSYLERVIASSTWASNFTTSHWRWPRVSFIQIRKKFLFFIALIINLRWTFFPLSSDLNNCENWFSLASQNAQDKGVFILAQDSHREIKFWLMKQTKNWNIFVFHFSHPFWCPSSIILIKVHFDWSNSPDSSNLCGAESGRSMEIALQHNKRKGKNICPSTSADAHQRTTGEDALKRA